MPARTIISLIWPSSYCTAVHYAKLNFCNHNAITILIIHVVWKSDRAAFISMMNIEETMIKVLWPYICSVEHRKMPNNFTSAEMPNNFTSAEMPKQLYLCRNAKQLYLCKNAKQLYLCWFQVSAEFNDACRQDSRWWRKQLSQPHRQRSERTAKTPSLSTSDWSGPTRRRLVTFYPLP